MKKKNKQRTFFVCNWEETLELSRGTYITWYLDANNDDFYEIEITDYYKMEINIECCVKLAIVPNLKIHFFCDFSVQKSY